MASGCASKPSPLDPTSLENRIIDLKKLYDMELYQSVLKVGNMIGVMCKNTESPHSTAISDVKSKAQILMGISAFHLNKYWEAKSMLEEAIGYSDLFALVDRDEEATATGLLYENYPSVVELKFFLHKVYLNLNKKEEAHDILRTIAVEQRTPKILAALATTAYRRADTDPTVIGYYKDILKVCPLAIDIVTHLTTLGIDVPTDPSTIPEPIQPWLSEWKKAYAVKASHDLKATIETFCKLLAEGSKFHGNAQLTFELGEALYHFGNINEAKQVLLHVQELDSTMFEVVSPLTMILLAERDEEGIARLLLRGCDEHDTYVWMPMAALLYLKEDFDEAFYCSRKAVQRNPKNVDALILQGNILMDLSKIEYALKLFMEAYHLAPARYEANRGVIECLMAARRHEEATLYAMEFFRVDKYSARSIALNALVLMNFGGHPNKKKAKRFLEDSLKLKPKHGFSVHLLARILEEEGKLDEAIELLESSQDPPLAKTHCSLGRVFLLKGEVLRARDHYFSALELDPKYQDAVEGLLGIDSSMVADDSSSSSTSFSDMDDGNYGEINVQREEDDNDDQVNEDENDDPANVDENDDPANKDENDDPANADENDDSANADENDDPANVDENDDPANADENDDPANADKNDDPANADENDDPANEDENDDPENEDVNDDPENEDVNDDPENEDVNDDRVDEDENDDPAKKDENDGRERDEENYGDDEMSSSP